MRNLITAFPEEFEEVRKGMSYVDDAQRDDYGNLALKAQVASSLGPGAFGRFMMDSKNYIYGVALLFTAGAFQFCPCFWLHW
jgi:hypothetical protein